MLEQALAFCHFLLFKLEPRKCMPLKLPVWRHIVKYGKCSVQHIMHFNFILLLNWVMVTNNLEG